MWLSMVKSYTPPSHVHYLSHWERPSGRRIHFSPQIHLENTCGFIRPAAVAHKVSCGCNVIRASPHQPLCIFNVFWETCLKSSSEDGSSNPGFASPLWVILWQPLPVSTITLSLTVQISIIKSFFHLTKSEWFGL